MMKPHSLPTLRTRSLLRLTRYMGFGQWALVFLVLAASVAFGQSGAVNGHIVDAAGSAVQGAEVTITNAATNQMYAVRTNGEGYYQFPSLTPGAYVIL